MGNEILDLISRVKRGMTANDNPEILRGLIEVENNFRLLTPKLLEVIVDMDRLQKAKAQGDDLLPCEFCNSKNRTTQRTNGKPCHIKCQPRFSQFVVA